jgi:biopolymer transport protein ExbB
MLKILVDGGFMMIPLVCCSILALAVFIDRLLAFRSNANVDVRSLRARVMDALRAGDVQEAAVLCTDTPGPVSAALLAGVQAYAKHHAGSSDGKELGTVVKTAMDDYSLHAMNAVEKRFWILSTIGNSAPLLGMTGTVVGMIASFEGMMQGGVDAKSVAGGISVALITTAAGLVIALLAVVPYNYFTSSADAIDLELEETKTQFIDFLTTELSA